MLQELRICDLGVVEDETLILEDGMTVVTGETGAGKTMLTEAIRLLAGGRSDPSMVRAGVNEARIEGRFVTGDSETVVSRVIAAKGSRARCYIDGAMASQAQLAELVGAWVDIQGQNAHHSLLAPSAQRDCLDNFAGIDTTELTTTRRLVRECRQKLSDLAGDESARLREIDLIRFQLEELNDAQLDDPDETETLASEVQRLSNVEQSRSELLTAQTALSGDTGAAETLAQALSATSESELMASLVPRLRSVLVELQDIAMEVERLADTVVDDPERLAEANARRHALRQIEKKYGPTLSDAITMRDQHLARLSVIEHHDQSVTDAQHQLDEALARLSAIEDKVRRARQGAAPEMEKAVQLRLGDLALPNAQFQITVEDVAAGDNVTYLLAPNPGIPPLPLAKAASGGELSRSMLALQLVLLGHAGADRQGPATLIFDEVDAGVGGEAAIAVGAALAEVAEASRKHGGQVFVVTHLAQVAAFGHHQLLVAKTATKSSTRTTATLLTDSEREAELARMLSGRPDSTSARAHARELLENAHPNAKASRAKRTKVKGGAR